MRDFRLRERRLKLGLSQHELGCLAELPPYSAQTYVSAAERGKPVSLHRLEQIRRALIWLETQPRRQRAWARADAESAAKTDAALAGSRSPETDAVIVERLVDLLWDGRAEDFDVLAARSPADLVRLAGDRYVDESTPVIPDAQAAS